MPGDNFGQAKNNLKPSLAVEFNFKMFQSKVCMSPTKTIVKFIRWSGTFEPVSSDVLTISQLPKLCVKISILMHRHMWARSFSTRLTLSLIHI